MTIIKKSVAASLLISLGVVGLFSSDYSYLSMILFSFGLLTICMLNLNLFTGKCGFIFERGNYLEVFFTLIINLISGFIIGAIISCMNEDYINTANSIIANWSISDSYFIKSIFCGVIMFLAVYLFSKGTLLGIFLGVPLFILCGFQHSIANVIIMGIGKCFNEALLVCVVGNFIGSVLVCGLVYEEKKKKI